jgi:hypothetical protein
LSKKGQIWSVDLASAAVILAFVLLFFILMWNMLAIRWNTTGDYMKMQTDAMFAAEALMTTPGEPNSWEMLSINNATSIGLVSGRSELNKVKIEKLISENSTNYLLIKRKLGLQKYDLGFNITDMENNESYYEFGRFAGGLDTAIIFERMGILDEKPVKVRIEVWK